MIDEKEIVIHSDEAFSKVAFLNVTKHHLEKKDSHNNEYQRITQFEKPIVYLCEENLKFDSVKNSFSDFFQKCKIFEKLKEEKIEMKINESKSNFFGSIFLSASGGSWSKKTIEEKTFFYFKALKKRLKQNFLNSGFKNFFSENVFESILHAQVFMQDMCHFEKMNQIYSLFFKSISLPPSRFCVTLPSSDSNDSSSVSSFALFFVYSFPSSLALSSSFSFSSLKDERKSLKISSISKW